ncbi:MAG TPA: hypothetical protein PK367_01270 [Candidatus Paceibacterota bacterium]|nr:hypothetical protein [Candidatus Paceibacterota bacterium]
MKSILFSLWTSSSGMIILDGQIKALKDLGRKPIFELLGAELIAFKRNGGKRIYQYRAYHYYITLETVSDIHCFDRTMEILKENNAGFILNTEPYEILERELVFRPAPSV